MNILQFISDNKEWIFCGIGVTIITIFLGAVKHAKKKKKDRPIIVKNYNEINNNQNNSQNNKSTQKSNQYRRQTNDTSKNRSSIELEKIRLYSTSAKGKTYTTKFYKSMNHNFGIEVVLRNNTSQIQNVKLGHCIYDDKGNTLLKGNFKPKINPYSKLTENIFVDANTFAKMKSGKYKSQFWIDDKKVQKVFFTIVYK